jgi:hypothetical protein
MGKLDPASLLIENIDRGIANGFKCTVQELVPFLLRDILFQRQILRFTLKSGMAQVKRKGRITANAPCAFESPVISC